MKLRSLSLWVSVTAVILFGTSSLWLHRVRARLTQERGALQQQVEVARSLSAENQRAEVMLTNLHRADGTADAAIQSELKEVRQRVAELEKQAADRREARLAEEARTAASRDPEASPVPMENFTDVGQATPQTTMQSAVWAAMKGNDARLGELVVFGPGGREAANQWMAEMPEPLRQQYPSPEKLIFNLFSMVITGHRTLQIMGVDFPSGTNAVINIRFDDQVRAPAAPLPMQLGPQGWQLTIPAAMIQSARAEFQRMP